MRGQRRFCRATFCLIVLALAPQWATAKDGKTKYQFGIASGGLERVLEDVREQTGFDVLYSYDLIDVDGVNAVSGTYTIGEALELMLQDTDLSGSLTESGMIVITRNEGRAEMRSQKVQMKQKTLKRSLLASVASFLMGWAANAQDVETIEDTQADQDSAQDIVTVTGSRIARRPEDAQTPTVTIDRDAIELSGQESLSELFRQIPSLTTGINSQSVASGSFTPEVFGVANPNLRGLGEKRTLVLVNGRRHIGSTPGNSSVDLNTLPPALIERIDTITGGASAVYGADAVSGVINIILKDDFEGLEFRARGSATEQGGAGELSFDLTFGSSLGERGSVYTNFSFYDFGGLRFSDRNSIHPFNPGNPTWILNPDPDGASFIATTTQRRTFATLVPGGTVWDGVSFDENLNRTASGAPVANYFDRNGNLRVFEGDEIIGGRGRQIINARAPDFALEFINDRHVNMPLTRMNLHAGADFDLTDSARLFFEGAFSQTESAGTLSPGFNTLGSIGLLTIQADNPYIGPTLAAILEGDPSTTDDNIESFTVRRRNHDFQRRTLSTKRNMQRFLLGLDGEILGGLSYEIYYQYGQTTLDAVRGGDLDPIRLAQSVDAVRDPVSGEIVCRDPSNGCAPLNVLGLQDPNSPELLAAVDFFGWDLPILSEQSQHVASASITGDLFELPAGMVGFAAGAEYREESSQYTPSPILQQGRGYSGTIVRETIGQYDVLEGFTEVRVPLVRDVPLVREANVEAAVRVADYSSSSSLATSWKFSGDWAPFDGLRFRAAYAQSVRAPNINELFTPGSDTFAFIEHPCSPDNIIVGANPGNRAANCAARGFPADFSPAPVSVAISQLGNQDLDPEVSKTLTAGFVFQPTFLENFSITADYWDIDISEGIDSLNPQNTLDLCFDSSVTDNVACDLVEFAPDGSAERIVSQNINISSLSASGIDFGVNYFFQPASLGLPLNGDISMSLVGSHLRKLESQLNETAPVIVEAGGPDHTKWRGNFRVTYTDGPLAVSVTELYLGGGRANPSWPEGLISPDRFEDQWTTNLSARYSLNDNIEFNLGVNNLFNTEPPQHPILFAGFASGSAFSNIGRRAFAGVKVRLN